MHLFIFTLRCILGPSNEDVDAQNEDVCCPYNDANNQAVVAGTGQANNSNQEERQYENIRRPDDNADDQSLGAAAIPK